MKRLTLLRHAKSSWGGPELEDFNRPLNDRGWKSSRRIGRELEHHKANFDLVIASPAARVRETIDGVTEKLKLNIEIRFEPRMYLASAETLLAIIRDLPEEVHAPLLVGHNPGLQQLLLEVANGPKSLKDKVEHKFPTAALAQIELPAHHWDEIREKSGTITRLILPSELD